MREIVFDTETTGFSPDEGDRLVEIGAVELIGGMPSGRTLQLYVNPERPMPAGAFAIHGLSDAFLAGKPRFADIAEEIVDFFGDAERIVAHNADFDFAFLNFELGRCGRAAICHSRKVDTVAIARRKFPGAKNSLDALCVRFGIDRSHRTLHGALLDAELLAQVYVELMGGRQIGLGLGEAPGGSLPVPVAGPSVPPLPARPPRSFAPSAAELERHAAFLTTIPDALWNEGAART